jgi:hypothetical protein
MSVIFDQAAALARRQHGRVSWTQLVELGIDRWRIQRWLTDGRLRQVHHGVYALGHAAPSMRADYAAAVLAGGPGAVLSHYAASHLLQLIRGPAPAPEITVPTRAGRRRPGEACIARNPMKHGAAKLRRALGGDVTLSDLESAFLAVLRKHGLPTPRTNVDRHGDKVDCHWPQLDLTIELHSFRHPATRAGFETDLARRRRSNHVAFSYGDVIERGTQTIAELAAVMRP